MPQLPSPCCQLALECFGLARSLSQIQEVCFPLLFLGWPQKPLIDITILEVIARENDVRKAMEQALAHPSIRDSGPLGLVGGIWGCNADGSYCPPSFRRQPQQLYLELAHGGRLCTGVTPRKADTKACLDFEDIQLTEQELPDTHVAKPHLAPDGTVPLRPHHGLYPGSLSADEIPPFLN